MIPTRTIDDIVRYCMEYQKKTGRILHYGDAVAMIEREERIAQEKKIEREKRADQEKKKKASTKRRRSKVSKENSKEDAK